MKSIMTSNISKKKVFIHIGVPKTGTTSIQRFFILNYDELKSKGVYYPIFDGQKRIKKFTEDYLSPGISDLDTNLDEDFWAIGPLHHFLKNDKNYASRSYNDVKGYLEQALSVFQNNNYQSLIISCESLADLESDYINDLASFFSEYDCSIILYVRDETKYLESDYLERLKNIYHGELYEDISDFIESTLSFYVRRNINTIISWGSFFGFDNINVRLFDKETLTDNDAVKDFLSIIGFHEKINLYPVSNISLNNKYAPLLEKTNQVIPELQRVGTSDFCYRQKYLIKPLLELSKSIGNDETSLNHILDSLYTNYPESEHKGLESFAFNISQLEGSTSLLSKKEQKRIYWDSKSFAVQTAEFLPKSHKKRYLSPYYNLLLDALDSLTTKSGLTSDLADSIIHDDLSAFSEWCFSHCNGDMDSFETYIYNFYVYKEHVFREDQPTQFMIRVWGYCEKVKKSFPDPLNSDALSYWQWWINHAEKEYNLNDILPINTLELTHEQLKTLSKTLILLEDISKNDFLTWWGDIGKYKYILQKPTNAIITIFHEESLNKPHSSNLFVTDLMKEIYNSRQDLQEAFKLNDMWGWWLTQASLEYSIDNVFPLKLHINDTFKIEILINIIWNKRIDLKKAFPDPLNKDKNNFQQWWNLHGYPEYNKALC